MKAISFAASLLMAGSAFAGSSVVTYTPSQRSNTASTYVNARVVKVNPRASTITFRSESREVVLTVEGTAVAGLGRLRAGDDVLLGYRMDQRGGRAVRVVNAILPGDGLRTGPTTRGTVTTFPVVTPSRYEPVETAVLVSVRPADTGGFVMGSPVVETADVGGVYAETVLPDSPYNRQIPSLPAATTAMVNVVPPGVAAPVLPDSLPVGAARDVATHDYENAVRVLSAKAGEIDSHWSRYRDTCLNTAATTSSTDRNVAASGRDREWFTVLTNDVPAPTEDQCRQLLLELNRMASSWKDAMVGAEQAGRAYDVLPGVMRETRQRYRVDF